MPGTEDALEISEQDRSGVFPPECSNLVMDTEAGGLRSTKRYVGAAGLGHLRRLVRLLLLGLGLRHGAQRREGWRDSWEAGGGGLGV